MRKAIQLMAEEDPEIKVVGMARDGLQGVEMTRQLKPDCITLDMEMPRMNGIEALEMIMRDTPTLVLVVSSISTEGAEITPEALAKGAMDFIPKTQSFVAIDITAIKNDLIKKLRAISKKGIPTLMPALDALKRRRERRESLAEGQQPLDIQVPENLKKRDYSIVAVGVSTGGPPVVQHILDNLPADFPAGIIIAQHMPETFTKPFADRLNKSSPLEVKEAEDGDELTKGVVLIGRGGKHLTLIRSGTKVLAQLVSEPADLLYFPSADVLFDSAVAAYSQNTLGVILTGMGHDGVKGLQNLHAKGGTILAQDRDSCVVYGMPKAAVDAGIADVVTAGADMPGLIETLVA